MLAKQIRAGDREAFKQLYERCWRELFLNAFHLLASDELAKDFTQDAFVKLWDNRHQINTSLSLKPYLYTILKNNIINYLKKEKALNKKKATMTRRAPVNVHSPADYLVAKELEGTIEDIIKKMPGATQRIWRMSRQEHMSVNEIAGKLDISPLTVKKQISNALKILRSGISSGFDT